jgi:hypothetical protein
MGVYANHAAPAKTLRLQRALNAQHGGIPRHWLDPEWSLARATASTGMFWMAWRDSRCFFDLRQSRS